MRGAASLSVDGEPATTADLAHQALVNYGAYTSFRVEGGGVRGLDLHLARLEASGLELFGAAVGQARLRELMRAALGDRQHAWLRVSLFSPEISHREAFWTGRPKVMVGVFDSPPPLAGPWRLQPQVHAREAPHLKHVATFGLIRARRAARAAGFDDALFVNADGLVSEGTLWNIGFLDGNRVVWPEAPMLAGVTQALIGRGLASVGLTSTAEAVRLADLARFDGAFICNSATPAAAVTAIGDRPLAIPPEAMARLVAAYEATPPEAI